jgi:hypothetical protein
VTLDCSDNVDIALSWIIQMVMTSKICGTFLQIYEFLSDINIWIFASVSSIQLGFYVSLRELHRKRLKCVVHLPDFSIHVCRNGLSHSWVIWRWFLTMNPWIQSQVVALYEMDKDFSLLIPLLHADRSPLLKACDSPDQAAQCHIICPWVWGFIFDLALGWLQSGELKFMIFHE